MSFACVIFDIESGTPLIIVADVTHAQLDDPAYNPPGSGKIVVSYDFYKSLVTVDDEGKRDVSVIHKTMIGMVPRPENPKEFPKAEIQNGAPNPPIEKQDEAALVEE